MVNTTFGARTDRKQPVIAVLPPFDYYNTLTVKADMVAVRLMCQLSGSVRDSYDCVLLDGYIDKETGQRHNQKAVQESLNHAIGEKGDCSAYKGLSLTDIDHAGVCCSGFLHCYREALALASLAGYFRPSKILIGRHDPNRDIFEELAGQMGLKTEVILSFGDINAETTKLIRQSNRALDIQRYNWYRQLKIPAWKRGLTGVLGIWSALVRMVRGRKPFVYIIPHGQLAGMSAQLSAQKAYYPVFSALVRLPLRHLLSSGFVILPRQSLPREDGGVSAILENYKRHLRTLQEKRAIGTVECSDTEYSIAGSVVRRLGGLASRSFSRLAQSIDVCEDFIKKNATAGALLSSDMNWDRRIIVRVFQKYGLKNMVLMNGWFGTKHMTENKSVDTVLCFGESYTGNYFKGKKNARVTGTFTFDAAYKKRNLNRPVFPVKKILVSTFTFSPADINCRYSDNERYLDDILTVIRSYEEKNGRSIHVALRPHPSDSPEFYRWYLDRSGFPGIEIRSGGGFQECVSGFDLFFGSYSTTVFESAAMGIPVIFYHPCNQMLYPPYDGSCNDLPSAFSREELARVFARVMEDRDFACGFTRRDVLKPYTGEMEGNAAQRIMREVISMTEH